MAKGKLPDYTGKSFEHLRLKVLRQYVSECAFPSPASWSRWSEWEERISSAHEAEEERLSAIIEAEHGNPEIEGFVEDEYAKASVLTRSMHAALVVAMWSEMEACLKEVAKYLLCRRGRNAKKADSLNIDKAKKLFCDEAKIDLDKLKSYDAVDAIRILNNAFKHSQGKLKGQSSRFISQWGVVGGDGTAVDYSKLDFDKLQRHCHDFCDELMTKVEVLLRTNNP